MYPFINWKEYAEEWKRRNENRKSFEKWRSGLLNIQEIISKTRKNINYKYAYMYFGDYKIAMKEKFWGFTPLERADFSVEETAKIFRKINKYARDTINKVILSGNIYDKNMEKNIERIGSGEGYKKSIARIILRQEDVHNNEIVNFFIVKVKENKYNRIEELYRG